MAASRPALPNELLLIIFQLALKDISYETRHLRASLALVSMVWRDLIYNTPSFWTTIHNVHLGKRNALALIKSGERPLDINLDCTYGDLDIFRASYDQTIHHSHRWRTVHFTLIDDFQLSCPAPLLDSASIKALNRWGLTPLVDIFRGEAPRLRSLRLDGLVVPWNVRMLSGLHALELRKIYSGGPTVLRLLAVLDTSPDLSVLVLHRVSFTPTILPLEPPEVSLPNLTELKSLGCDVSDISYLLSHIQSPRCETLFIGCRLDQSSDVTALMESVSPHFPSAILVDNPTKLTITSGYIDLSIQYTPQHKGGIRLQWAASVTQLGAILSALLSNLARHVLAHETELAFMSFNPSDDAVSVLNAAGAFKHITTLTLKGLRWSRNSRVMKHLSSSLVFPALRDLRIDVPGMPPGVLPQMVEGRRGPDGPAPFTCLTIGGAGPEHNQDRELIESIIGSDRLLWTKEPLKWQAVALDEW